MAFEPFEALGIGGPYPALVFSGPFTPRRRRRDCLQKIFCRRFVANSHVRRALIINDPPRLDQPFCFLECLERVNIAAQGRSIADDVRAIGARSVLASAGSATFATSATFSDDAAHGVPAVCSNCSGCSSQVWFKHRRQKKLSPFL